VGSVVRCGDALVGPSVGHEIAQEVRHRERHADWAGPPLGDHGAANESGEDEVRVDAVGALPVRAGVLVERLGRQRAAGVGRGAGG
jgi:hypothetical protein